MLDSNDFSLTMAHVATTSISVGYTGDKARKSSWDDAAEKLFKNNFFIVNFECTFKSKGEIGVKINITAPKYKKCECFKQS